MLPISKKPLPRVPASVNKENLSAMTVTAAATTETTTTPRSSSLDTSVSTSSSKITCRGPQSERYDTPPNSMAEAVSPVSSRKRGQLRAASLGISPSGIRNSRNGFGSGLAKVPTPVFTKPPSPTSDWQGPEQILEPRPMQSIPSIDESRRRTMNIHGVNHSRALADPFTNHTTGWVPSQALGQYHPPYPSVQVAGPHSLGFTKDPRDANPYAYRADEIGPTHRIPGVGHLGDLLPPPGWKEGDEPFDRQKVQALYDAARQAAKTKLETSMKSAVSLADHEYQKRSQQTDQRWSNQFKLDERLLNERINIYEQYQTRKSLGYNPDSSFTREGFVQAPPNLRCGLPNPNVLDPSLITSSYGAYHDRYQTRQDGSEQQVLNFLANYGPHFSNGPISQAYRAPNFTQPAGTFAAVHTGYVPRTPNILPSPGLPRPLPYVSPRRVKFADGARQLNAPGMLMQPPIFPASQSFPQGPERLRPSQSMPLITRLHQNEAAHEADVASRAKKVTKTLEAEQPAVLPKKKRSRNKVEKPKTWYHEELEKAKLPTSEISQEAMQAGIEYGKTGITRKAARPKSSGILRPQRLAPKIHPRDHTMPEEESAVKPLRGPRRSRNMPMIDPNIGMKIPSAKAAAVIIRAGAADASGDKLGSAATPAKAPPQNIIRRASQAFASLSNSASSQHSRSVFTNPPVTNPDLRQRWDPMMPKAAGPAPSSSGTVPIPTQTVATTATTSRIVDVSMMSEPSSEEPDDPTDANFGEGSTRRKSAASKAKATSGSKRKNTGTARATKRSRVNTNGGHDDKPTD